MSLSQLSQLLPLPNEELQQVLDYAKTLPKPEAASHFTNLLGDSPQAIEFISSFNSRRQDESSSAPSAPSAPSSSSEAAPKPKARGGPKKKRAPLHTPEARKVDTGFVPPGKAYSKNDDDFEYIRGASAPVSHQPSRTSTPKPAAAAAAAAAATSQPASKPISTAGGYLISESLHKKKPTSNPSTRSSTPKPSGSSKTKVTLTGGTPMIGQSSAIADLDAAIRNLELSTDPTSDDVASRACNCVATRHPLQNAAPNCLACGKVICAKEGLGPCTYCGTPLLTPDEVATLVRELKDERGRERSAADAAAHRKTPVSKTPAPFSKPSEYGSASYGSGTLSEAEARAKAHRDKLLNFQANNARRTTVRDEAADFDATSGGNMWSTPEERAKALKKQQKMLREMEWNARPEYEKRQQVASIDLVNGRVVRRMAAMERPTSPEEAEDVDEEPQERDALADTSGNRGAGRSGGAFSSNPLLGKLIKPVFEVPGQDKGKGKAVELEGRRERKKGWRRVQDDLEDNEDIILDGGVFGHEETTASSQR